MKKRLLAVVAALFVCGATSAFATGVGVQFGYNPVGGGSDAALTFKLNNVPAVFAADVHLANSQLTAFGLTADFWAQNPRLSGMIHYYWGPGVALSVYPKATAIDIGGRLLAGLNVFPVQFLEIYLQGAWQPNIYVPFDGGDLDVNLNCFPINLGVRFWF